MQLIMVYVFGHLTVEQSLPVWLPERKIRNLQEKSEYRPLLTPNVSPPSVFKVGG
jgi:hypothetical protein